MKKRNKYQTRILQLKSGGFVPQVRVDHFLWGHHWEGIYEHNGELFTAASDILVLKKCKTDYEKAGDIVARYVSLMNDYDMLQS